MTIDGVGDRDAVLPVMLSTINPALCRSQEYLTDQS